MRNRKPFGREKMKFKNENTAFKLYPEAPKQNRQTYYRREILHANKRQPKE